MRRIARIATIAGLGAALTAGTGACAASPAAESTAARQAAVQAVRGPDQPVTRMIARLFTEWNAALATGDPRKVADRYAPDAVLLPTVSNRVRTDRAGIVDYFTHFLRNKPQGEIKQSTIDLLDLTTAIDTGVYVFTLTQDGKKQQVEARYTFVYELRRGKWLIVNHHSSVMPEQTTTH
ncbi:DUF4440 domain-containing protein [Actinoplanes sp. ATCC 53533]|uniref:SgcJ/EcaC family oxidoreductase n=1 Tax=Actinoplanes sp. ATCC 53533 TaxID=1288362 RepID=UPI000F771315|nr:SgcJ/EcaC family oxidoreductase [Actinoplanes sp. ATCC 53533]RSM56549.1 DUF4440 domain-containing protein [Actinoplanes sp. ATCC 53533]